MKRVTSYIVLIFAMVILTQACASSQTTLSFEPGAIDTDKYVRKVDQFVVIADGSLSMNDRWQRQRKLGISEEFLISLNQTTPDLGYDGGLRTFGRGLCKSQGKTVSIIEIGEYLGSSFGDGVARFNCANGTSPLNLALDATGADLFKRDARTAIVIISDGLDMGKKEVGAAEELASAFGENLEIYAVQIGNNKKGRQLLEQVVAVGGSGYLKPASKLTTSRAMAQFVADVFLWPDADGDGVPDHLDKCPDTPRGVEVDAVGCPIDSDGDGVPDYLDKCPGTPRGVPVDDTGCPIAGIEVAGDEWFVRGQVLFDVNRNTIKPEAAEILLRVANFLRKNQQYVVEIQGNTDSTGPLAWNMQLSEKRADAVKSYMVANGVAADRLTTKGFGPNEPLAPNNTAEGRAKNRRVDFKPTMR